MLILNKSLEFESNMTDVSEYFSLIDRGNLQWPTDYVIKIVVQTYLIFLKLISRPYEDVFLKCKNHKLILEQLTLDKFEITCELPDKQCVCGNKMNALTKQCLSVSSNIFINNYVKNINDKINVKCAKRKLSTLTK